MSEFVQDELFSIDVNADKGRPARSRRTDPMFLRNEFPGGGKFSLPHLLLRFYE